MKNILTGLLLFCLPALLGAQEAVIREITGTVEVKSPGEDAWSPAVPGQRLERASLISTGFRSTALLGIGNSTLTVRPLTRLSLEELTVAEGNETVNIGLRAGRLRAEVTPPSGGTTDFTVRSPSITASVRGTIFEFDGLKLAVDQGRVHVAGDSQSGTYVGTGHTARVDTETGRTVSAAETAQETLVPAAPVGTETAPEVAPPPTAGNLESGFLWE
jgi:hypothetical protein